MLKRKRLKEKGKLKPAAIVRNFQIGDFVILLRPKDAGQALPMQFHGKMGKVVGKQGKSYIIGFLNGNASKSLVLEAKYLKPANCQKIVKK